MEISAVAAAAALLCLLVCGRVAAAARAAVGTLHFDQMFTAGLGHFVLALGLLHDPALDGCWRRHLRARIVLLVSGQGILRVGFRIPRLVTLPGFLDEGSTVVFALLPQRGGDALVARTVGERGHLDRQRRKMWKNVSFSAFE